MRPNRRGFFRLEIKKKAPVLNVWSLAERVTLKSRKVEVNLPMIQSPMTRPDTAETRIEIFKYCGFGKRVSGLVQNTQVLQDFKLCTISAQSEFWGRPGKGTFSKLHPCSNTWIFFKTYWITGPPKQTGQVRVRAVVSVTRCVSICQRAFRW